MWVMRTIAIALLIACGAAVSASAGASRSATLRLVDRDPLTLRGQGFQPRERVLLTFSKPISTRRVTRAGATGSFRVSLTHVSIGRCDAVRVVAAGNSSRAVLKVLPAPACLPARAP